MTAEQTRLQAEARARAQGANQQMRAQAQGMKSNQFASQTRMIASASPEYAYQVENYSRLKKAEELKKNVMFVGGAVVIGAVIMKVIKPKKKGRK